MKVNFWIHVERVTDSALTSRIVVCKRSYYRKAQASAPVDQQLKQDFPAFRWPVLRKNVEAQVIVEKARRCSAQKAWDVLLGRAVSQDALEALLAVV